MSRIWRIPAMSAVLCVAVPAMAQDSVSRSGTVCPGGDALNPYGLSNQCASYVVNLTEFQSSWNNTFGIAPIIKSSKTSSDFFSSQFSAQGISRLHLTDTSFFSPVYDLWGDAGFGINASTNDDPPATLSSQGCEGNQFGVAFAEFSTTDGGANYNAVIGGLVNVSPVDPSRLFVSRVVAALNGRNDTCNNSQLAMGSVDEHGNVHLRADGFGVPQFDCSSCSPLGNPSDNIFRVDMSSRNCGGLSVISDTPICQDQAATDWLIVRDASVHNPPAIVPEAVTGTSDPLYIGSNFDAEYLHGANPPISTTTSHLCQDNHRGNLSYAAGSCATLGGTMGVAALLSRAADPPAGSGLPDAINVFGLSAPSGAPAGSACPVLPAAICDNTVDPDLAVNLCNAPGENEFTHYQSQVAFRGGNGQVALNFDQQGRLLMAAPVDHPNDPGADDWEFNYIAVARMDCATGDVEWTLAGHVGSDPSVNGFAGKAILDGPGGNVIGRMIDLAAITGDPPDRATAPFGPSVSAPMIDSVGNVYFLSSIELRDPDGTCPNCFDPPCRCTSGLLRAVYDPATFSYELELLLTPGDTFAGLNSGLDWRIGFIPIAESATASDPSVASDTAWSQNISQVAHLSQSAAGLDPADPRTLGGMVLRASITYDVNQDTTFQVCDAATTDGDEVYNVLLYIGSTEAAQDCVAHDDCNDCNPCTATRCTGGTCESAARVWGDLTPQPAGFGVVDVDDILFELAAFGSATPCTSFPGSNLVPCLQACELGNIDVDDLLAVLAAFAGTFSCDTQCSALPL